MNTFIITYLDKYEQVHTTEVPADDVEAAVEALEEGLDEQIRVKKIEIVD
jgi:hypothetical protein